VALEAMAREVCQQFAQAMETLQFKEAYGVLNELVNAGNKYVDTEEPWALNRDGRRDRLETVLRNSLEICRICAVLLSPVCPTKAAELLAKLGIEGTPNTESIWRFDGLETGAAVAAGDPLFPRMRELPEVIQQALEAMETAPKPPKKKKKKKEKAVTEEATETTPLIEYDDFVKVALRAGLVQTAEKHPKADRLLVLTVDVGETEARTIVAGLAEVFSPEDLVGRRVVVVTNLAPRKLRGVESQGMILAAGGGQIEGLVELPETVMPGAVIR
jgi:methionyl-tRNA synthetase